MTLAKELTETSCIVPFYNEGKRVLVVVKTLLKVGNIHEIICVDDGSTDGVYKRLEKFPSKVRIVRISQNLGKTKAVLNGLKKATGENILLFDADLRKISVNQIKKSLERFEKNGIDMIILRRMNDPLVNKLIRTDIVISGQRILKTEDLKKILKAKLRKFQLELAINDFMLENKKRVFWMPLSCQDVYKREKYGLIKGTQRELSMYKDLISFKGVLYYFWNLANFCWSEYKDHTERV